MTISELFTLAFVLFVFGTPAAVFVFVSLRVWSAWLRERGFFVQIGEGDK